MKKFLRTLTFIVLLLLVEFFGIKHWEKYKETKEPEKVDFKHFVLIESYDVNDKTLKLLVDKDTKVMYLIYSNKDSNNFGITVMLDQNGKPILYEGEF